MGYKNEYFGLGVVNIVTLTVCFSAVALEL